MASDYELARTQLALDVLGLLERGWLPGVVELGTGAERWSLSHESHSTMYGRLPAAVAAAMEQEQKQKGV
jgi:hypothetical protein